MKNIKIVLKEIYGNREIIVTGIINNLFKWGRYNDVLGKKKIGVIKSAPDYVITVSNNYREEWLDSLAEFAIESSKATLKRYFSTEGNTDSIEVPVEVIIDDTIYPYVFKFTYESDGIIYSNVNMMI